MKIQIKSVLVLSLLFISFMQYGQSFQWIKQFGGNGNEHVHALSVNQDQEIIFCGDFSETMTIGNNTIVPQAPDIYIAKTDSIGNPIWATSFPGAGFADVFDMKTDNAGNIYLCGAFEGNMTLGSVTLTGNNSFNAFVAKLNNDGVVMYAKKIGGSGFDDAASLDIDSDGNVYILGSFQQTIVIGSQSLISNGGSDIYICKLDIAGNILWARNGGGVGNEFANDIKIFENTLLITGSFSFKADFSGTSLNSVYMDVFLIKYDEDGNLIWAKSYGNGFSSDETFRSISIDKVGNIYACGSFGYSTSIGSNSLTSKGKKDILIAKFDVNGNPLWAASNGSEEDDIAVDGYLDANDNFYLTGLFSLSIVYPDFDLTASTADAPDVFILKFDKTGKAIWGNSGGGSGFDSGGAIYIKNDKVYLSGYFNKSATFDNITLPLLYDNDNIFISVLTTGNSTVGLIDHDDNISMVKIYPNPFFNMLNISLYGESNKIPHNLYLKITDIKGYVILTKVLNKFNENILLDGINSGIYNINIASKNDKIIYSGIVVKR